MKPAHWILLVLLILLGAGVVTLWIRKDVTLIVDGETHELTTLAFTVERLLQETQISLDPADQIDPPPSHRLAQGEVIRVMRAGQVRITADGRSRVLVTPERDPVALLALADVTLGSGDRVLSAGIPVDLTEPLPEGAAHALRVVRSVPITVQDGETTYTLSSTAPSLGQALWQAGFEVYAADILTPTLDTPLTESLQVWWQRSRELTIQIEGRSIPVRSTAQTVGEVLMEAGLSLQGLDYSMPPENAPLPADGVIRVVRVQEQVILEQEPIPFETEFQLDPNIEIDQRGVSHPGAYGVMAKRIRVRYEEGQEVSRQVEDEWLALEPQPRVMGYGTKIVTHTLETEYGPLEYWRAISMYATSYSPCRIFTDRCDSVTSSGATLQKGVAAVTLRHYRSMAGSRVYVPGYGIATILDVGGGIPGRNWIDLGFSEADYQSWHQWVTIYFLTPVPPESLILYDLN